MEIYSPNLAALEGLKGVARSGHRREHAAADDVADADDAGQHARDRSAARRVSTRRRCRRDAIWRAPWSFRTASRRATSTGRSAWWPAPRIRRRRPPASRCLRRCRRSFSDRCSPTCRRSIGRSSSTRTVLTAVFGAAEKARPTAKAALASAKAGKLGPAALEALEAGDQPMAAFIRGVDFFAQGQNDRAMQQFQVAMQQAPTFAPTRLYLGAALVQSNRHREAAGLLQSVLARHRRICAGRAARRSELAARGRRVARDHGAGESARTPRTARPRARSRSPTSAANRPADAVPLLARIWRQRRTTRTSCWRACTRPMRATCPRHAARRWSRIARGRRRWAKAYCRAEGRASGAGGRVDWLPAGGEMRASARKSGWLLAALTIGVLGASTAASSGRIRTRRAAANARRRSAGSSPRPTS